MMLDMEDDGTMDTKIQLMDEPDTNNNILLEAPTNTSNPPGIKGATIEKLVQRLTYEVYGGNLTCKIPIKF